MGGTEMSASNEVRVSIANLVWTATNTDTGEVRNLAVLNKKALSKGERLWSPLGGGAMLTPAGKKYLEDEYQAHSFELDKDTGYLDARFLASKSYVSKIFLEFNSFWLDFEHDASLDALQEIKELNLFSSSERAQLVFVYDVSAEQAVAPVGTDTSTRAGAVPTHRLFRIYTLLMPDVLFEKIFLQKYIRSLTTLEVATTDGGLRKGNTTDGDGIQNNFF